MYRRPSVPRSIGGVLDDTFQLYKASFSSCWQPALLVSLVTAVLSYAVVAAMPLTAASVPSTELFARYRLMFTTFGIWYVVVLAITAVFYAMLIVNIESVSRGETPAFGASLAKSLRRAPALFLATVIFAIALTVGFILLIIPGFYVWNRLQLYLVPVVAEPQGPGESLATSWRLVGGNWWRTATVVFVMFVILLVLQMVLGALAGIIALFTGGTAGLAGNPAAIAGRVSLISLLVGGVVRIFTLPLIFAAFVALYQDLVLRKGGGDLEARLGALPKG
jgi:hypothetical protein